MRASCFFVGALGSQGFIHLVRVAVKLIELRGQIDFISDGQGESTWYLDPYICIRGALFIYFSTGVEEILDLPAPATEGVHDLNTVTSAIIKIHQAKLTAS